MNDLLWGAARIVYYFDPAARGLTRIVVFRALPGIGDFLCSVPALRALRRAYPHAIIDLVGLPSSATLAKRFCHYVDRLLPFPGWPGIPEVEPDALRLEEFLETCRKERYDLSIQLHGDGSSSNSFTAELGAGVDIGCRPQDAPVRQGFLPFDPEEPEVVRNMRVVSQVGASMAWDELEFPVMTGELRAARELRAWTGSRSSRYAVIHPGGSGRHRGPRQPEIFAAAGRMLARRGYDVLLTGVNGEKGLVREVAEATFPAPTFDVSGLTSLGVFAGLLSEAALVLSDDSGAAHMAEAVGAPSVVLLYHDQAGRWGPRDTALHTPVLDPRTPSAVKEACMARLPKRNALHAVALAFMGGQV